MYKYKKTIIINNRRRRIFSKEKSNTEYILYKKEYITLNAYNKKNGGGGLVNLALRRWNGVKDEFEIKLEDIKLEDIDNYNQDISNKIAIYLKKKFLIPDSNKKIWIITELNNNNKNPIRVKGYTTINDWIMENPQQNLIKYGNTMHTKNKIHINEITGTHDINIVLNKILVFYQCPIDIPSCIDIKILNDVYNKLKKEGYYIYYTFRTYDIATVLNNNFNIHYSDNSDNGYKIGRYYNFNNVIFKCTNIKKDTFKDGWDTEYYQLYFKYIDNEDEMNEEIKKYNSRDQLIKYGQEKHLKTFKIYNRLYGAKYDDIVLDTFNKDIQDTSNQKNIDKDNFLYYYDIANKEGNEEYYKLNREGYFIYTSIEYENNIYTDTVGKNYEINNAKFICTNINTKVFNGWGYKDKTVYQIFKKFVTNKINEFEIPSKIIDNSSIYDSNGLSIGINNYNKNISDGISKYLQENSKINNDTDKTIWVITEYNNPFMIVSGYTKDEWGNIVNEINTEDALIKYGNQNHEVKAHEYTDNYTDNSTLANDNKIKMYISDTLSNAKIKTYLFYNYLANKNGKDIYMKLKTDYFIYLTIFKNTNTDYEVGNQYYLLDTYFTCTKNIELTNRITTATEYLIVFRFDGDDVKAPKQGIEEPRRNPPDHVKFGGNNKYKKTDKEITVIYKKKEYKRVIYICERKKYVKINKTFMLLSKLKKV